MAVYSYNPDVDAVGSCLGVNSIRVNAVVDELSGEKIDIVFLISIIFVENLRFNLHTRIGTKCSKELIITNILKRVRLIVP